METLSQLLGKARKSGQPVSYIGDHEDWYVVLAVSRDSDIVTRANFEALRAALNAELGPEGSHWIIERFTHWACGWIDYILVEPNTKAEDIARKAIKALENYPVLDDELLSKMEYEEACAVWDNATLRERICYCKDAGISIFAARHEAPPENVILYLIQP